MNTTIPSCLLDLSVSPLSERELPRVSKTLRDLGIAPQWQHTIEKQAVFFLELRTELNYSDSDERALAERLAIAIWKAIGRFVRIVMMFPQLETWPGGIEFDEHEYTRLLRQH